MKWSVVVTTAPRKQATLHECIDSLIDCGWQEDIFVLGEPGSEIPNNVQGTVHVKKQGIWRNWIKAVEYALTTNAEYILTVQDDSLFHPESKEFVEEMQWPHEDAGFVSLYTPRHYTLIKQPKRGRGRPKPVLQDVGIRRIYTKSLWGACALMFPREVLEHLMRTKLPHTWLGAPPRSRDPAVLVMREQNPHLIANSDTAIGKFMNWNKYSMWFIDPSPVAHIAKYSTIKHGGNTGNRNAYRIADHTQSLKSQVFPESKNE